MSKKDVIVKDLYRITPENLAKVGLLEDAYDCYNAYLDEVEKYSDKLIYPADLFKIIKSSLIGIIQSFYSKSSFLYPLHKEDLGFEDWQYNWFCRHITPYAPHKRSFESYINRQPLNLSVSFTVFLHAIENHIFWRTYNRFGKPVDCTEEQEIGWRREFADKVDEMLELYAISADDSPANNVGPLTDIRVYRTLKNMSCVRSHHKVGASVRSIADNHGNLVKVYIHHCNTCGKDFIGEETLRVYYKQNGYPKIIFHPDEGMNHSFFLGFANKSELYKNGYNVQQNGMAEEERRNILKSLIDTGTMSYLDISRDLNDDIHQFERDPRFINAVRKWRSDLKFLNEYMDTQK